MDPLSATGIEDQPGEVDKELGAESAWLRKAVTRSREVLATTFRLRKGINVYTFGDEREIYGAEFY